jgi:S1-C subfamily serine protease
MTVPTLAALSDALADLAAGAHTATACLHVDQRRTASAFHWKDGLHVAPEELVDTDEQPRVTLADGTTIAATVVGRDPSTGIALLKPEGVAGGAVLEASADALRPGHIVVLAGRDGDGPLAALGSVAKVGPAWRSMRGGTIDHSIDLAVPANGQFEGSAVLDATGALIGMLLFGPRRRALVIPHETIARSVATLLAKGHVARGYLGAGLHPLHGGELEGAIVMRLDGDGPAKSAGLLVGDILVRWNDEAVSGPRSVVRRLGADSVGQTAKLGVLRSGTIHDISVELGEKPIA